MNTLNYPYNLSKSSFVNFSLTSWPIALGVLHYLHAMALMEREPDEIDDFDGDEKEDLCVSCYEEIMAENNHEDVLAKAAQDYEDWALQDEDEVEAEIKRQFEHYNQQNALYQNTMNEKMERERELQSVVSRHEKTANYLIFQQEGSKNADVEIEALEKKIKSNMDIAAELKSDLADLNAQIGDKDTALDLKNKLEKIQDELGRVETDRVHYEGLKGDLDVAFTKLKDTLDDLIQTYNQ